MFQSELAFAGAALLVTAAGNAIAAPCAPHRADPVDSIRQMYAALTRGDRPETLSVFAPDATMIDGGARFTPAVLTDLILKTESSGTIPQWQVEDAERHITCNQAWATWTNHGTFTTGATTVPKTWFESAVFIWRNGHWQIRFFHSSQARSAK